MGDIQKILKFYSRKDIQKAIVQEAQHREVAIKYGEKGFGKRPDILQFESDIAHIAKDGASSFHISEEHWHDPLQLKTGMSRKELDDLRKGWDLILDIDCPFVEFSNFTAQLLIKALEFNQIHRFGLKFSGNHGFHIAVPFSSFPEVVNNKKIANLFPEGPRMIADYLSYLIKDQLREQILAASTPKEIMQATNIPQEKLINNHILDPYALVDIDTILISSRHLFRSPYSVNEKSGLISVVLKPSQLKNFKLSQAKMENIETPPPYMPQEPEEKTSTRLLVQSFDHAKKKEVIIIQQEEVTKPSAYQKFTPQAKVQEELFPPCMTLLLKGVQEDGRKRAVLIMINFLKQMKYTMEDIEKLMLEWNKKNHEPLREGYLRSQLSWHKRNPQTVLPPNCANDGYYVPMGICKPDNFCQKRKNPVNYTFLKLKLKTRQQPKRRRKSSKKPKSL
jgi:hypothetical protein